MAPIPQHLQVSQLRLRSILAGVTDYSRVVVSLEDGTENLSIWRGYGGDETAPASSREVTVPVSHVLELARLESDHPARAPVAPTPLHTPPNARGKTFDPAKDEVRLGRILEAVLDLMKDGQWRTLYQVRQAIYGRSNVESTEAGISARLRDLRKPQHGGHTVEVERVPETSGLWRYRVVVSA